MASVVIYLVSKEIKISIVKKPLYLSLQEEYIAIYFGGCHIVYSIYSVVEDFLVFHVLCMNYTFKWSFFYNFLKCINCYRERRRRSIVSVLCKSDLNI